MLHCDRLSPAVLLPDCGSKAGIRLIPKAVGEAGSANRAGHNRHRLGAARSEHLRIMGVLMNSRSVDISRLRGAIHRMDREGAQRKCCRPDTVCRAFPVLRLWTRTASYKPFNILY